MSPGLDLVLGMLAGGVVVTLGSLTPAISRRLNPGYAPHPDPIRDVGRMILRDASKDLKLCMIDHPEDVRLSRVEANLRWLLDERI